MVSPSDTCDLTLDPNTANNYLTLSEGNKKATCDSWRSDLSDHLERFDTHPQVLCREGLTGRHYWEVEWSDSSNESVYITAAYKGVERKGGGPQSQLGCNINSWSFGKSYSSLKASHDVQVWNGLCPPGSNRVGVYLDWPAGTLSFYSVSSNILSHLYTFCNRFTEPVYPGFLVGEYYNYVHLRSVE